jgi:hypothetical protein
MKIQKTANNKKLILSKKEWESIGKKAGWTGNSIPKENEFGYGLDQKAMDLLFQYDITNSDLWRYDSPDSSFKEIYNGLQEAKKGNLEALKSALESKFGKIKWHQKRIF